MEVKQIEAKDTIDLRNTMLRPGLPPESCMYDGDNDENTFHLGAYIDDRLVSIASFYMDNTNYLKDEYQFRLRGMATEPDYQNQGLSKSLLQTAFAMIKKNNVNVLWCNARTSARGFYEKVGFSPISEEFEIKDIGPHFVMKKDIA